MNKELQVSSATSMLRMIEERLKSEAPTEYEKYIRSTNEDKLKYIRKNWQLLDLGYDKKLLKKINSALHPLLKTVVSEEINKEIVKNHISKSNASMHNIVEFGIILQKYANYVKQRSFEEESRLSLLYYLIIVESSYTADINLLTYLLTRTKIRYHRTKSDGSKKYIRIGNLRKLDKEALHDKLTFLKENGFEVISNKCDRPLRNSLAHMNFIVFTDGSVAYERDKKMAKITKLELENKIAEILSVCQCIAESLKQFYGQKYGDLLTK